MAVRALGDAGVCVVPAQAGAHPAVCGIYGRRVAFHAVTRRVLATTVTAQASNRGVIRYADGEADVDREARRRLVADVAGAPTHEIDVSLHEIRPPTRSVRVGDVRAGVEIAVTGDASVSRPVAPGRVRLRLPRPQGTSNKSGDNRRGGRQRVVPPPLHHATSLLRAILGHAGNCELGARGWRAATYGRRM
jgi:hypothetical protein